MTSEAACSHIAQLRGVVFISHSSRDAATAMQIVAALEAEGVRCWIAPRDIPAGADYNHSIMTGIMASAAMVLVYSRHSVNSDPVVREIERAQNRKVPVIPIRLEKAPPSPAVEYLISTAQWVDAYPPPLKRHLAAVVSAVKRAMNLAHEAPKADPNAPPQYVGQYRIVEKIGEGGMGAVYKAEQRAPVKRTVALKLIRPGLSTQEVLARFESERQALARMNHPNVARVIDAGVDDKGYPFFAMEYVPGVPITQFADANKLSIHDRLLLFKQVCAAIGHAHTKSLLHRDVKASNVLAYMEQGKPTIKVIDFGIAKALTDDRLTDRTFATARGLAVGTYESMSPEQADGSPDIDTRTDVYSLGVLLYELLSGAKPFDEKALRRGGNAEIRRIIREVDPPRPSTRLSGLGAEATKVAAARQAEIDTLSRELRRELDWIPLMAIRKERERRYSSAAALADDIQNYLDQKPLIAAPDSMRYRVRKLVRRNKGPIAAVAAVILILAMGVVGTSVGLVGQARARADAERNRQNAERDRGIAQQKQAEAEQRQKEASEQRHRAEKNWALGLTYTGNALLASGSVGAATSKYVESVNELRRLREPTEESDLSLLNAWRHGQAPVNSMRLSQGIVNRGGIPLAFSPDRRTIAVGLNGGTIEIRDLATLRLRATLPRPEAIVSDLAFSTDGQLLLAGYDIAGTEKGEARLWDVGKQAVVETFPSTKSVASVAISEDSKIVAVGNWGQPWIVLYDRTTHMSRPFGHGDGAATRMRFSSDGKRLTVGHYHDSTPTVRVWDIENGLELARFPGGNIQGVSEHVVAVGPGGSSFLDQRTGEQRKLAGVSMWNANTSVVSQHYSKNSQWFVLARSDGVCHLFDTTSGAHSGAFLAPRGVVRKAIVDDAGELVAAIEDAGRLYVFRRDAQPGALRLSIGIGHINAIQWCDAGLVAVGSDSGEIALVDAVTLKVLWTRKAHGGGVNVLALSMDGTRLVSGGNDSAVRVWDTLRGEPIRAFKRIAPIQCLAISPDGQWVAAGGWKVVGGRGGRMRVFNIDSGDEKQVYLPGRDQFPIALRFSDDGRQLFEVKHVHGLLAIHDLERASTTRPTGLRHVTTHITAISPNGRHVLDGSRLFDVEQNVRVGSIGPEAFYQHTFSPDGLRLASAANREGFVRISEVPSLRKIGDIKLGATPTTDLVYSPDGTRIAFGTAAGDVVVWDLAASSRGWPVLATLADAPAGPPEPEQVRVLRLARWYAAIGVDRWAYELFVQSRDAGEKVSPLEIARCAWKIGELSVARQNFEAALAGAHSPADKHYLHVCLRAIGQEANQPTTQTSE